MIKKRNSFPFFTLLVCSLAIIMIAFIGYMSFHMLSQAPEITFRSWSAQKPYDGTALTEEYWEMESGELKDGHEVKVEVYGSQTNIGTSKNYFKVRVYDAKGKDVSRQYMIVYTFGMLTVYDPNLAPPPEYIPEGSDPEGSENNTFIKLFSSISDVVYLRHKSYGNFTGIDWNERIPSYGMRDAINPLTYVSYAMEASGYHSSKMDVETNLGVTYSPYHLGYSSDLCDADDRIVPYMGSAYTASFYHQYNCSVLKELSLKGTEAEEEELLYREYVRQNYLEISTNEKNTMLKIAYQADIDANNNDVIEKVADYIMNAATYNLNFKPYPANVNHAIYFLTTAKEGVCVQYATAATLMFRALGIPARYVTGYMGHTEAYKWVTIDGAIGHAWVEVYIDGLGWIPVEVTPPTGGGSGDPNEQPKEDAPLGDITLQPVFVSKKYDGMPLRAKNKVTGFEEWEAIGYSCTPKVSGSRLAYGYGVSSIDKISIWDPYGQEVTDQFSITFKTGKLHVYYSQFHSSSDDTTHTYDGQTPKLLVDENFNYKVNLMKGHTFKVIPTAPAQVGEYANTYEILVTDEEGVDVSDHYEFVSGYGKLTINAREITLTPVSVSKVYDGKPLVSTELIKDFYAQVADYHKLESFAITGSQTEIGYSHSVVTDAKIIDGDGNDVTGNYFIVFGFGTLTVTAG